MSYSIVTKNKRSLDHSLDHSFGFEIKRHWHTLFQYSLGALISTLGHSRDLTISRHRLRRVSKNKLKDNSLHWNLLTRSWDEYFMFHGPHWATGFRPPEHLYRPQLPNRRIDKTYRYLPEDEKKCLSLQKPFVTISLDTVSGRRSYLPSIENSEMRTAIHSYNISNFKIAHFFILPKCCELSYQWYT